MNSIQSVTLQTAVLMQVQEFAKAGQSFSIHDITTAVRRKVNNGELEIPEVEVSGASFRFDIPHVKVKGLFEELWRTGVFDPEFTLDRNFNGMYNNYTPVAVSISSAAPVTAPTPSFAQVPPLTPVAAPVAPTVKTSTVITDRVQKYLGNCKNRNFRPSLKQVQSAIKRGDESTGVSCDDLKALIQSLGYTVVDNPDSVSRAQVAI